ncbi:SAM-dependent methyltransferase [Nocardioides humi]|uniref:tRNA (N6-threonylcarbamoyladenosine(37)-N6)-methyltransferase TrmO n=1 Tax=Nocardioides humi TaxID=449461 RepID=A0ABN2B6R7_9ACTN|nr:SAM-dependent methyltransferase [Nocardioides humi]
MLVTPIGMLRTPHTQREHTPIQATANLAEEGVAEIDARFAAALDGLSAFSHAWLLTWLGDDPPTPLDSLHQRPFLRQDGPPLGVFAMRGPRRPVPIGLSLVEVVDVGDTRLRFRGVDMVDGTPLLDIKPFFPAADQPRSPVRAGWFDEVDVPEGATPASLRAAPAEDDGRP